jgi:hypothetical protein
VDRPVAWLDHIEPPLRTKTKELVEWSPPLSPSDHYPHRDLVYSSSVRKSVKLLPYHRNIGNATHPAFEQAYFDTATLPFDQGTRFLYSQHKAKVRAADSLCSRYLRSTRLWMRAPGQTCSGRPTLGDARQPHPPVLPQGGCSTYIVSSTPRPCPPAD